MLLVLVSYRCRTGDSAQGIKPACERVNPERARGHAQQGDKGGGSSISRAEEGGPWM